MKRWIINAGRIVYGIYCLSYMLITLLVVAFVERRKGAE